MSGYKISTTSVDTDVTDAIPQGYIPNVGDKVVYNDVAIFFEGGADGDIYVFGYYYQGDQLSTQLCIGKRGGRWFAGYNEL